MTHFPLFTLLQPVFNPHDSTLIQDIVNYFSNKICEPLYQMLYCSPDISQPLYAFHKLPQKIVKQLHLSGMIYSLEIQTIYWSWFPCFFQMIFTLIFIPLVQRRLRTIIPGDNCMFAFSPFFFFLEHFHQLLRFASRVFRQCRWSVQMHTHVRSAARAQGRAER